MATTSNQHYLIRNTNLRNELLKQTDFYILNDVYNKLTETQQKEIIDYRQALRDIYALLFLCFLKYSFLYC